MGKNGEPTSLNRDLVAGVRWPLKVIVNMPGPTEVFRLDRDPDETSSLADEQAQGELTREVLTLVQALERPEPAAPHPMSAEARDRLKALGYVD
jgi:hypothetical protein